jgi:NADP-dependent 3-hydroxy acid dehydrogenase YdfG
LEQGAYRLHELRKQILKNSDKGKIGGAAEEILIQRKLDVTSKSDCDSFVDTVVKKWGRITILINNAGLMPLSYFKNCKVKEWEQMIDVNIEGVMIDKKIRTYS